MKTLKAVMEAAVMTLGATALGVEGIRARQCTKLYRR